MGPAQLPSSPPMDYAIVRKARPYLLIALGILTIVCRLIIESVPEAPSIQYETTVQPEEPTTLASTWRNFFDSCSFLVPVLIIDSDILGAKNIEGLPPESLDKKLLVAVEERFRFSRISKFNERLEIVFYSRNRTGRDYWLFERKNESRAMQPFKTYTSSQVSLPSDIPTFLEDWKHSRFIECHVLINRNSTEERTLPLSTVDHMADLRDFIKKSGARIMLAGGTALGWYRECSLIPHTTDIDFFIRAEEYNTAIIADLDAASSPYTLTRIYGRPSDSYEITVNIKAVNVNMDLFFLYTNDNESFVGGLAWYKRQKFKWMYPRITSICTAALHGRLFHVPCNVKDVLDMEYGNWREDSPSEDFVWFQSHRNIKDNGRWSGEEMSKMRQPGIRFIQDIMTFFHDINLLSFNV